MKNYVSSKMIEEMLWTCFRCGITRRERIGEILKREAFDQFARGTKKKPVLMMKTHVSSKWIEDALKLLLKADRRNDNLVGDEAMPILLAFRAFCTTDFIGVRCMLIN